jgi:2-keto-4-pentenoate hydratase/2-oxohepta-3-ene-1,7-dioic acid hydratase in catechol pathway
MARLALFVPGALLNLALAGQQATKIIRFKDSEDQIHYGELISGLGGQKKARALITDDPFDSLELHADKVHVVKELLAPVPMPPAILGIGLNYWGHINASHLKAPKTPSLFFKNRFAYNHPFHPIVVPPSSSLPDYEGELAIVIGKNCKDVSEEDALSCVLGYTICNDFSARCYQAEDPHDTSKPTYHHGCLGNGGQFSFSKGFDSHCPLGPALVPTSVLGDGSNLRITTWVNNETSPRQNETTSEMIFGIKKIVSFISTGTTLEKGDVFCTGTPDGVGDTMKPPRYMQDGDVIKINIDKIGTLVNHVIRTGSKHTVAPQDLSVVV